MKQHTSALVVEATGSGLGGTMRQGISVSIAGSMPASASMVGASCRRSRAGCVGLITLVMIFVVVVINNKRIENDNDEKCKSGSRKS